MAKLSSKERNKLPKSDFGLPGKRGYPMPDKSHASNAKARASQAVNEGRMSRSTESKIDAKADRIIDKDRSSDQRADHPSASEHLRSAQSAMSRASDMRDD